MKLLTNQPALHSEYVLLQETPLLILDIWNSGLCLGWVLAGEGRWAECRGGVQGSNKLIELSTYEEGEAWGHLELLV